MDALDYLNKIISLTIIFIIAFISDSRSQALPNDIYDSSRLLRFSSIDKASNISPNNHRNIQLFKLKSLQKTYKNKPNHYLNSKRIYIDKDSLSSSLASSEKEEKKQDYYPDIYKINDFNRKRKNLNDKSLSYVDSENNKRALSLFAYLAPHCTTVSYHSNAINSRRRGRPLGQPLRWG